MTAIALKLRTRQETGVWSGGAAAGFCHWRTRYSSRREYEALKAAQHDTLATLAADFDTLVERMQGPQAHQAGRDLFSTRRDHFRASVSTTMMWKSVTCKTSSIPWMKIGKLRRPHLHRRPRPRSRRHQVPAPLLPVPLLPPGLVWSIASSMRVRDLLSMPFHHPATEEGLRTALRDAAGKLEVERGALEVLRCQDPPVGCCG